MTCAGAGRRVELDLVVAERVDQQRGEDAGRNDGTTRPGHRRLLSSDSVGMHRRAGEHDPEQEQHDDRADVDEHLHPGDELLAEQDVLRRAAGEHDDEEQRGVHDVLV